MDRRSWLKYSGAALAGAGLSTISFKAGASLSAARIRFGYITDTLFTGEDEEEKSARLSRGKIFGQSLTIADDLMSRFEEASPPVDLVVHGGGLFKRGLKKNNENRAAAQSWLEGVTLPIELSEKNHAYLKNGVEFIHFPFRSGRGPSERDMAWLEGVLSGKPDVPAVLVTGSPAVSSAGAAGWGAADELRESIAAHPRVVLAMSGGAKANRAGFIPGTSCLNLTTSSPIVYPCGARIVDLEVSGGEVVIRGEFIQTRFLTLVEKSYHQARPLELISNLGERKDRRFTARPPEKSIEPNLNRINPGLAPVWDMGGRLSMAVVSDTHVCLDKHVDEKHIEQNRLIGHFNEKGSVELLDDVLDQVSSGRHRVEFYDDLFDLDREAPGNFLEQKIDTLLFTGDLTEHGFRDEAEIFREKINALPQGIRQQTLVTLGNHDRYPEDFSPRGPQSDNSLVTEFYKDYMRPGYNSSYAVRLTDWLTLIVLDSVIPSETPLGLIQEKIDWLEDQVRSREKESIVIACHHPLYQLTLVPPLMQAYLRSRSHFTSRRSAVRAQLHRLFSESPHVKLIISGHYHGVVVDQYDKVGKSGEAPDDNRTTHVQVPCTVEYPCAYRLFTFEREGGRATVDYRTAYTRLSGLRRESGESTLFKLFGTNPRPTRAYRKKIEELDRLDNFYSDLARIDPHDLSDTNVRGFKDGSARMGRGKGGKRNIAGKIVFSL